MAIDAGLSRIEELPLEKLQACSPLIGQDIYGRISPRACMENRRTAGGPAPECTEAQLRELEDFCRAHRSSRGLC